MAKKPVTLVTTAPVVPHELFASMSANSDHVVALLVSQAEAAIIVQEKELEQQIEAVQTEVDAVDKEIKLYYQSVEDHEIERHEPILKAMKSVGLNVRIKAHAEDREVFIIIEQEHHHRHPSEIANRVKLSHPKRIDTLSEKRDELVLEISDKQSKLIELRHKRRNGLPTLERWAKGRVAQVMLENAGEEAVELLEILKQSTPPLLE